MKVVLLKILYVGLFLTNGLLSSFVTAEQSDEYLIRLADEMAKIAEPINANDNISPADLLLLHQNSPSRTARVYLRQNLSWDNLEKLMTGHLVYMMQKNVYSDAQLHFIKHSIIEAKPFYSDNNTAQERIEMERQARELFSDDEIRSLFYPN